MTQEVDSAALALQQQALGLSGIDAEQQTFLDDGNISQTTGIDHIARRSRSPFRDGIFHLVLDNIHAVAGELKSFADPYKPISTHNGYPAFVDPKKFEIWLLSASCRSSVGSAMTWAALFYDMFAGLQGVSRTAAGGPVGVSNRETLLFVWTDFATILASDAKEYGINVADKAAFFGKYRLVPDEPLILRSEVTAGASVTMVATLFIGPVALGQDIF